MTLSRQLIMTLLCVMVVLISSLFWLNLKGVQNLLSRQMSVQTQNAVDSLALSLKEFLRSGDLGGAETIVNGFYDHGFYQYLSVADAHKKGPVIERSASVSTVGVPGWFINLVPLKAHIKTAEVLFYQSGHSQKALITLEANNMFAYEQLWSSLQEWIVVSLGVFFAGALLVLSLIRWQLSPLRAIEEQALAISRREFFINSKIPRSRELKRVVLAMNGMSEKLARFVEQLTERAERLLDKMREDDLTGLMNRQNFMDNFRKTLNDKGVMTIIHVHNIHVINDAYGYQTGNEVLRSVARILQKEQDYCAGAFAGRISGVDFAIAMPGLNIDGFNSVYRQLDAMLKSLSVPESVAGLELIVGAASYNQKQSLSEVLARSDHALAMAIHQEKSMVYIEDEDIAVSWSATDWGKLIDKTLAEGCISLVSQNLIDVKGKILYRSLLARPRLSQADDIKISSFVAMAEMLGHGVAFDRLVTSKVFQYASGNMETGPWGVKLLASSWLNGRFQEWFLDLLGQHPSIARNLFVICTESSLTRHIAISKNNIDSIRKLGGRIVMDHFGGGVSAFATLRQLHPDFIKLDGSYVRDILHNSDNKMFMEVASEIAHALDIGVIAEHVENDEIKTLLNRMDIDAFQGYAISPVEVLDGNST